MGSDIRSKVFVASHLNTDNNEKQHSSDHICLVVRGTTRHCSPCESVRLCFLICVYLIRIHLLILLIDNCIMIMMLMMKHQMES